MLPQFVLPQSGFTDLVPDILSRLVVVITGETYLVTEAEKNTLPGSGEPSRFLSRGRYSSGAMWAGTVPAWTGGARLEVV